MKAFVAIAKAATLIVGVCLVLWFGYAWVADYGDGVASGTYKAVSDGTETTLVLEPDHSFHQTRVGAKGPVSGAGTWRRFGESGLVFSGSMLQLPHQRVMPNGDAYATLYKTAGIWPHSSRSTQRPRLRSTGRATADPIIEAGCPVLTSLGRDCATTRLTASLKKNRHPDPERRRSGRTCFCLSLCFCRSLWLCRQRKSAHSSP